MKTSPPPSLESPESTATPDWHVRMESMRRLPAWLLISIFGAIPLLIGWLDHLAGRGASLFVFYAVPVFLSTWLVNRKVGIWLAVLSGPVWLVSNHVPDRYPMITYLWMMVGRIAYFVFVAIGAAAMRNKQEADAGQIELLKEMRHLEMEIVTTRESEQQRIGQDLHDGLCQELAAIGCAVRALADDLQARGNPEASDAEKIGAAIEKSVVEARDLAAGMASVHVGSQGLAAALATLAQTTTRLTGVAIRLHAPPSVKVDNAEAATHLFRIAQEAVGNAVRHSGANEVSVRLDQKGTHLELRIDDNGRGLPATPKHRVTGIGMQTMRFRAHAVGADFIIHPRSGGGTSVRCALPLENSHPSKINAHV